MEATMSPECDPHSHRNASPSELTVERIYHDYHQRARNIARKMLRTESDVEDVTQDVLLQVVRKLPEFRGEAAISTWLHRVTVNAALAHRRKKAIRAEKEILTDSFLEENHQAGFGAPPDELLEAEESKRLIKEAIADLPPGYREVFVLSEIEGVPNAEIGERLELSLSAVKSRLHRARTMMREALAPHFDEALHPTA